MTSRPHASAAVVLAVPLPAYFWAWAVVVSVIEVTVPTTGTLPQTESAVAPVVSVPQEVLAR